MSQCASTVSVPHLIPRTVFPLTPSRPPRTVLTVSVYTWDLMNATGRVWDSDTAERVLFPLPFHLSCLELASALGMVFSFLHCRFVLRVTCVLLSGIDLVMACSVLSFLWGGIPLDFLFWIRAPELASLFPQLLWFYKGHLRSLLLCFSSFPIPLSWAEQNNFLCERALNYRFLYSNGASVTVSCLLVLLHKKTNFCLVFLWFSFLGRSFLFLVST